jgi:NitT/TauT family transport system substrate-binding protein
VDTIDWINGHREEASAIVGERLKKLTGKALPAEILKSSIERTDITYDPLSDSILTFADWSKSLGYLKEDRSALGGLFDTQSLNAVLTKRSKSVVR